MVLILSINIGFSQEGTYRQILIGESESYLNIHKTSDHVFLLYLEYQQIREPLKSRAYWGRMIQLDDFKYRIDDGFLQIEISFEANLKTVMIGLNEQGGGRYVLTSRKNPKFIETRTGKKMHFSRIRTNTLWE